MNDARNTLHLTFELPHSPKKVWRALTEPELLARWLMKTNLDPKIGNQFEFRMDPTPYWDGVVDCEVLEIDPYKSISYAWRALGVDTVVRWTLEESNGKTILKLEQSGFKPDQKQAFGGARGGWMQMAGEALPKVLAEME